MKQLKTFYPGLVVFALAEIFSMLTVAMLSLTGSANDFDDAEKSWNCAVSHSNPTIFGPTFCLPPSLQIVIFALIVSGMGLGAVIVSYILAQRRKQSGKTAAFAVRMLLAAVVVGMTVDFQFFAAVYFLDYRGPLLLAGPVLAAAIIGKFVFPEMRMLFIPPFALLLVGIGFFSGILLAAILGIPFD